VSLLEWGLSSITALLLTATLLPLSRIEHWCVRGLDFPRMQIACALAVLLATQTMCLSVAATPLVWSLWLLTMWSLALQAWWILPYTRLHKAEVLSAQQEDVANTVRVMTANVLTTNRNVHALLALVERYQPDLLVTLETDQWWQDKLSPLKDTYPHRVQQPMDNLYGMHLFSRYPSLA